MSSVGGVLVAATGEADPFPVSLGLAGGALALPTLALSLPLANLGEAFYRSTADELRAVEVSLSAVLSLTHLTQSPPHPPMGAPGAIHGPAWGQIYYGPAFDGENKRYVVVSHDLHNIKTERVLAVRTTSQTKSDSASFPRIEGGKAQACCGNLTYLNASHLNWQPGQGRPHPSSLVIDDMVAIARGLKQTHGL